MTLPFNMTDALSVFPVCACVPSLKGVADSKLSS